MMNNYSIVEPFQLYPVISESYIITGTPFLYLKNRKTIVLGDIHLGHESSLFGMDQNTVSATCISLTDKLLEVVRQFDVEKVICNGDIKHSTNSIKLQELEELKYFTTNLIDEEVELVFIRGNHDRLLEFIFPHVNMEYLELLDDITIEIGNQNILIHHGHLSKKKFDCQTMILSHEHPAYTFWGANRARVKLPAFVYLKALNFEVIILPSANNISSGTVFPLKDKTKFLSPFLRQYADLSTTEIFPFDTELGLLELPPVVTWFKDQRDR